MSQPLRGRPASDGLAFGAPVVFDVTEPADDAPVEGSFADATVRTAAHFDRLAVSAAQRSRSDEAEVLEAYAVLVRDPDLRTAFERAQEAGRHPVGAVRHAVAELVAVFAAMDDPYLRQRAEDIAGVGRELVACWTGQLTDATQVPDGAIVCAVDLTPADTVRLDLERIGGLATEGGGPTSHTTIVARSLGVPAVVGVTGLLAAVADAELVLLDGERGEVVVEPGLEEVRDAELRLSQAKVRAVEHRRLRGRHVSFDGSRILVAANIGAPHELEAAVETAADGIGLYRSEFLFLDRMAPPTVDEQRAAYAEALAAFEDPTVVRTLDIGGDKEIAYLRLAHEANPFLGVRGLRLCLEHPDLFDTQLDALVAEADDDRLRVMFPMVSSVGDLDAGLDRLEERARVAGSAPPAPGIMIETPAAALLAPQLARRCAFFSIGTNDLTQYVTAADRTVGRLEHHQDAANPAVLQLVARTCEAAAAAAIPVAVCGEAASDPIVAALLLGLGVSELSVAASLVDRTRWLVTQLDPVATRAAARAALDLPDADAVRSSVPELT